MHLTWISWGHVALSRVERTDVYLLHVLYVCVFWRGEAELLKIHFSLESF
jgi:hypothetical protein